VLMGKDGWSGTQQTVLVRFEYGFSPLT
jgi:hypothetical protein